MTKRELVSLLLDPKNEFKSNNLNGRDILWRSYLCTLFFSVADKAQTRRLVSGLNDLITVNNVAGTALTAVMALLLAGGGHSGHEDTSTAGLLGAGAAEVGDLTGLLVNLVVLEGGELDLSVFVFVLLGGFVDFFLTLLSTTTKAKNKMEGRLLLDVVIAECSSFLQLLAGKDQAALR